jgi:hypothetical protein
MPNNASSIINVRFAGYRHWFCRQKGDDVMAADRRDDPLNTNPTNRNRLVFLIECLALTVLSSYICAGIYVAATFLALPPSDAAYRRPLALLDPFLWTVAIPVATVVAIIVFPIALFSLWHNDPLRSGLFVLGTTVFTILIAAPYLSVLAIPIAVLVAILALLFCRFADVRLFR